MSATASRDEPLRTLTVVIPARDEEGSVGETVRHLHHELAARSIAHEIIVVDDGSADATSAVVRGLAESIPQLRLIRNDGPNGFGRAVVAGIDAASGDAVAIMMADESDDCRDVVGYWETLNEGYDAVFGSRFIKGGGILDYPKLKYALNRLANLFIKLLFRIRLNDTTNAF